MQTTENYVDAEPQFFNWIDEQWDIAAMLAAIRAGSIHPKRIALGREFIEAFGKDVLGMIKGDRTRRRMSVWSYVDMDKAMALPREALQSPVILFEPRAAHGILQLPGYSSPRHVLGDGQHRMALAYHEMVDSMPALVLSRSELVRFQME